MPFTNAANLGGALMAEPRIVAPLLDSPRAVTYARLNLPVSATEPQSASPKPSRIDFLPSSMTSSGTFRYTVLQMNVAISSVKPSILGKAPGVGDCANAFVPRRAQG